MPLATEQRAHFGIPDWLISYRKRWLRPDMIAGVTAAAVVLPKSMASASVAGLQLQVGLYTAFLKRQTGNAGIGHRIRDDHRGSGHSRYHVGPQPTLAV